MSKVFEVVVVGAGMFGSAAAKHLSAAGADVLLVGPAEPNGGSPVNQYEFGAYFDEARITRRSGWDEVWGTMDARSLERFREIEDRSGIPFFHDCGSLVLMARSIEHRTNAILRQCDADGIAVDRMSEESLKAEFPELGLPPMVGGVEGLLERDRAGYVNPRQLVKAQLTLTTAAGGRLLRAAITSVEREERSGLWHLSLNGGNRDVRAEKILVATGAFTNHNNALPASVKLALYAFAEPNLLFEIRDDQLDALRRVPALVTVDPEDTGDANMSLYMLPPIRYADGRWYMRIGPGMQPIVEELQTLDAMTSWYAEQTLTARQTSFLTSMMQMLVPRLAPASVRPACCIIEKTPSRRPYIGYLDDDESLAIVVGGNGHGARGSDEIGRLASRVVLEEPWDSPIACDTFTPILANHESPRSLHRPEFLKPPFGLC